MVPLSPATVLHIEKLFRPEEREAAEKLLCEECADNLPFSKGAGPVSAERIRFAVLKLSGGSLDELKRSIDQAKIDWRDVLVAAGFGHSVNAHRDWRP